MEFIHKVPSVEAYNKLRVNSGMNSTKPNSEVKKALDGTLFAVSVYEDNELIGLGRVVGDGGITFVVSDIMVDKKFQRRGIANKWWESLINGLMKIHMREFYYISSQSSGW